MAHSLRLYLVPLHGDLLHGRMASSLFADWRLLFLLPCPGLLLFLSLSRLPGHRQIIATWPIACGSTLFHYMVSSSMAGWLLSSSRTGVFSSCCLALDSSSSFPCPAFRAIAKSFYSAISLLVCFAVSNSLLVLRFVHMIMVPANAK
ncbi:hypothetical protein STEG23_006872, partial [Scotinomys teguina]